MWDLAAVLLVDQESLSLLLNFCVAQLKHELFLKSNFAHLINQIVYIHIFDIQ